MTDSRATLNRPLPARHSRAFPPDAGFDRYPDAVFPHDRRFDLPPLSEDELLLDADTAWARQGVDEWAPWPELDEEWPVSHDLGGMFAAGSERGGSERAAQGPAAPEAHPTDTAPPEAPAPPEALAANSPDAHLAALEAVAVQRRRATAEEYRLIALILDGAVAHPEPWVGPDPTLDLAWDDARGRSVAAVRRDRLDMAERAAVAEVAVRLRLSEQTVRVRASQARTLQERTPVSWQTFVDGRTSERHAVETARLASSLPHDDPDSWTAFDAGAADRAQRLTPARFAVAARALRERVHAESIEERHRRAARDRGVWVTAELDGMATLSALMPADRAYAAMSTLDRAARHLATAPGEDRTLAQLRADVMADLLVTPAGGPASRPPTVSDPPAASGSPAASDPPTTSDPPVAPSSPATSPQPATPTARTRPGSASIVVTVPALTLLGAGDEPALLDGYGPIDLDTARRLAGESATWTRLLTHPLTGVPLALDRTSYRVTAALRRWLGVTSPTCIFPGCGRAARACDIDHLTAWSDGGTTDADNLEPECRPHHRLRHETKWTPVRDPDSGDVRWRSPLGHETGVDPPPF